MRPSEICNLIGAIERCLLFEPWDAVTKNKLRTLLDAFSNDHKNFKYNVKSIIDPLKITVSGSDDESSFSMTL